MIHRLANIQDDISFLLLGPRQTGKTTLIQSRFKDAVYTIDLLQHDVYLRYSKNPGLFRKDILAQHKTHNTTRFFVDEIQRVPALLDDIHSLIESHHFQFMLTGSSSRKLKRSGANLLAGRAVQKFIFPYVYQEIADSFDLERVLRFGTLPSIYQKPDALKIEILNTYTQTYLKEEIQAEALVRSMGAFANFLEVAAAQSGELLNYTNIGRDCGLAAKTVQNYYQILEDTLIGFRLLPWRKSVRRQLGSQPKFYIFDTGVLNSLNHRLNDVPDLVYRGRLFEHLMILEAVRHLHYVSTDCRLYFWYTHDQKEVDLVIEKHQQLRYAIEFKSASNVSRSHLSGLHSFANDNPNVPCILVCNTLNPYEEAGIQVWPWQHYLGEITRLLA